MSHYFRLNFVSTPFQTEGDAMCFCMKMAKLMSRNREIAKERIYSSVAASSVFSKLENPRDTQDKSSARQMAIQNIIYGLFQIRMVYWPRYQMLAIAAGDLPKQLEEALGVTFHCVEFQNGTDQDYALGSWPKLPFFDACKRAVSELSDGKVRSESEFEDSDIGYCRRSLVYKRVFKDLRLNDWLYGREFTEDFVRISVSGITGSEDMQDMTMMLKARLASDPIFAI